MDRLTEAEVVHFLQDVDSGEIALSPQGEPQLIYAGNVEYQASNGWRVVVYNDCNEWDYIDEVVASDGRFASIEDIEDWPRLVHYRPSDEAVWARYRIPGHMKIRCNQCGGIYKYRFEPKGRCLSCVASEKR